MRWASIIIALSCACRTGIAAEPIDLNAVESFPYTAYATGDNVQIRSGPGANYYPTAKLSRGDTVEIYRHDPGGWYAIRPPQGSFSWVASRHLTLSDNQTAQVAADGVVARVGSALSDLRDVTQVRLDQGEQVELIDAPRDPDGTPTAAWWKIAPPAGEFRWVQMTDISRDPPVRASAVILDERGQASVSNTTDLTTESGDRSTYRKSGWMAVDKRPGDPGSMTPEAFGRELTDIELGLSTIVAKDPGSWQFESLLSRCDAALQGAPTQQDRERVRALHGRITKFDELRRRQRDFRDRQTDIARRKDSATSTLGAAATTLVAAPTTGTNTSTGPALGSPAAATSPSMSTTAAVGSEKSTAGAEGSTDPNYDGVGRLTRVVSKKNGTPNYALVSPSGEIVTFVSPAPGVSLFNYAGREVGLNGKRGFSTELNKPHLTAQRVTVIR